MKIVYTDHGLDRLKERGITKKEVQEAIDNGRKDNAFGGSRRCTFRNKKGSLIVIYNVKDLQEVEVITAYRE